MNRDDKKETGDKRKYRLLQLYLTIKSLKDVSENELFQIILDDCIKQLFRKEISILKIYQSKGGRSRWSKIFVHY